MTPPQRLLAWQRAHALAGRVRVDAARIDDLAYPGLRTQLARAAALVPDRIAVGAAEGDDAAFVHHLQAAAHAARALEAELTRARDLAALPTGVAHPLLGDAGAVRRLVAGLLRRIAADAAGRASAARLPSPLVGLPLLTDPTGLPTRPSPVTPPAGGASPGER
jgi:four helix bundle protein